MSVIFIANVNCEQSIKKNLLILIMSNSVWGVCVWACSHECRYLSCAYWGQGYMMTQWAGVKGSCEQVKNGCNLWMIGKHFKTLSPFIAPGIAVWFSAGYWLLLDLFLPFLYSLAFLFYPASLVYLYSCHIARSVDRLVFCGLFL